MGRNTLVKIRVPEEIEGPLLTMIYWKCIEAGLEVSKENDETVINKKGNK